MDLQQLLSKSITDDEVETEIKNHIPIIFKSNDRFLHNTQ